MKEWHQTPEFEIRLLIYLFWRLFLYKTFWETFSLFKPCFAILWSFIINVNIRIIVNNVENEVDAIYLSLFNWQMAKMRLLWELFKERN